MYVYEDDGENCYQGIKLLEKAAAFTMPEWSNKWYQNTVFCETELNILSMLADAYEVSGDWQQSFRIRRGIYIYLEKKHTNPDSNAFFICTCCLWDGSCSF